MGLKDLGSGFEVFGLKAEGGKGLHIYIYISGFGLQRFVHML